jgi:hypothetical protein
MVYWKGIVATVFTVFFIEGRRLNQIEKIRQVKKLGVFSFIIIMRSCDNSKSQQNSIQSQNLL